MEGRSPPVSPAESGQQAGALPSVIGAGVLDDIVRVAQQAPRGTFVEVGVYKGGSAQRLLNVALSQGRELWLFDTFEGIPFKGQDDHHEVGDFGDVDFASLRRALWPARFVHGVFPETLTPEVEAAMGPLAFVHVDCDQYVSVRSCIERLIKKLVPGGVMWFDDVLCLAGATRAVEETIGLACLKRGAGGKVFYVAK